MEDSNYKREIWNNRAIKLLNLFGWNQIGDSGIDLADEEKVKYGIDTLYSFKTPLKDIPESLILEAKSYNTKSFSKSKLQEWIDRLNLKIIKLRNSEDLIDRFPIFNEISKLKIGLICIWFDNVDEYKAFRPDFLRALRGIKVSSKQLKSGVYNKIYVIDNDLILRLCSLHDTITNSLEGNFRFYYPPTFVKYRAIQRSKILILEYFFSKFILGKLKKEDSFSETNIVFYWGELDFNSFLFLKEALMLFSFIDQECKLIIYKYKREDADFRKIRPGIVKLFEDVKINCEIKDMQSYQNLPTFIL